MASTQTRPRCCPPAAALSRRHLHRPPRRLSRPASIRRAVRRCSQIRTLGSLVPPRRRPLHQHCRRRMIQHWSRRAHLHSTRRACRRQRRIEIMRHQPTPPPLPRPRRRRSTRASSRRAHPHLVCRPRPVSSRALFPAPCRPSARPALAVMLRCSACQAVFSQRALDLSGRCPRQPACHAPVRPERLPNLFATMPASRGGCVGH